jgi:autotransporter-associated beta strand protein
MAIIAAMGAWPVPDAHATLDASTAVKYEIDADGGERVDSKGAVINEDGQRAGWYWSSNDGVAPPPWEQSTLRVYRGIYAWRSVMNDPDQYRNEQKPIASWDKADGTRFFRFAFCAGLDMATPSGWTCLVQWWQLGTSPPVGIWMYDDRKPRLRTKDDFGSATASNPRITSRWTDPEPCTDGAWHNYLVKIKWGVTDGELELWRWENEQWVSKYSVANTYIGYHDEGMEQGNYTWKMGGYRETGQGTWDVFYDELKYASTWEEVLLGLDDTPTPAIPVVYWTGEGDRWGGQTNAWSTIPFNDPAFPVYGLAGANGVSSGDTWQFAYDFAGMRGTTSTVRMNRNDVTMASLTLNAPGYTGFTFTNVDDNGSGIILAGPVMVLGGVHRFNVPTAGRNITLTANSTWDIACGAILEFNHVLAGTNGLNKTGEGAFLITGNQLYTGETAVSRGVFGIGPGPASLAGGLSFAPDALLRFSSAHTLTVGGTVSFENTFGITNLHGLDSSVALGNYQLISGTVDFQNVANVGPADAVLLGGDKRAFFENSGGLRLRVAADFPGWPQPTVEWIGFDQGRAVLALQGLAPAGYTLQTCTNAVDWEDGGVVFMSASPALWTSSTSSDAPRQFFRARLNP